MKKSALMLLVFLLLAVTGTQATWERQVLGPDVVIESLTLNPYPVEPGKNFDLTIKVRNSNTKRTILNPRFTIQESYPFSLETQPKVQVLKSLIPNEETLVTFKVKIDEKAIADVNNLVIEYQEGANSVYLSNPIGIDIKSVRTDVSIAEIETIPDEIFPGDEAQLKLILTNTLPVLMKNIELNLDLSSSDTPFMPLKSTTQKTLTALNKGSKNDLLFDIAVEANAEPKVYKVPLTINYNDEFGNPYTISSIVGIKVSTMPKLQIDVDKTEVTKAYSSGNIMLKISNNGLADLKFLSVKLQPSNDYKVLSTPQIYIGNLESDDYETAEFKIYANAMKELNLKLLFNYKDAFNNEYEKEEVVLVPLYSGLNIVQTIAEKLSGIFMLISYIIMISFVIIFIKEWRRTKDASKAAKEGITTILVKIKRIIKSLRPSTIRKGIKAAIKFFKEP